MYSSPAKPLSSPLRLLAFDTSTELMSVAVCGPAGVFSSEAEGGAQASVRLIPDILALLDQAGCSLKQLDAIAFGRGPGAFTGLRAACSVAQGLAFGADKPVLPIDSLLAVAQDALMRSGHPPDAPASVWVAMDARMSEIYAAQYRFDPLPLSHSLPHSPVHSLAHPSSSPNPSPSPLLQAAPTAASAGGRWHVVVPPVLTTAAELAVRWAAEPPTWVAGSALLPFGDVWGMFQTEPSRWVSGARPRALAMLPLAESLWGDGGAVDAALALPVYVRDKVAQTTAERDAARALKEAAPKTAPEITPEAAQAVAQATAPDSTQAVTPGAAPDAAQERAQDDGQETAAVRASA